MSLSKTLPMAALGGKTIDVPSVGFGTWADGNTDWCKEATLKALKAGYRHLDCAWKYGVDEEVGAAIRESGIPRSEIFITSKFWPQFAAPENVEKCLDLVLKNMGLDYIDLFLAHWPVALKATGTIARAKAFPDSTNKDMAIATAKDGSDELDLEHSAQDIAASKGVTGSFLPTWKAMQALVKTGKVKAVGVSNFSIGQLIEILPAAGKDHVPISCNQIEAHPWLPNKELIAFMHTEDILPTIYSPFAGQKEDGKTLLKDDTVLAISKKRGLGTGTILQSWAVQRGTIPLGKSQNGDRIKANLAIERLSKEDMDALDGLAMKGDTGRTIDFSAAWGVKFFAS